MERIINTAQTRAGTSALTLFFKRLSRRISRLFEPEEVEVTFKVDGSRISYTYTKVEHKQVA